MPTFVLLVATFIAWAALEVWYVLHHQPTITEQTRALDAYWPTFGRAAMLIIGVLVGHLFLQ
jgi:peptidoglycan/LPS O-acetylase OafA/YrhL